MLSLFSLGEHRIAKIKLSNGGLAAQVGGGRRGFMKSFKEAT